MPPLSTSEGMLVPRVNLHDVRSTKALAIAIAITEAKKDKIVHEDTEMDTTQSLGLQEGSYFSSTKKKPLALGSHSQASSKAFTLEHRKGPLTLEPRIKSPSKAYTL